MTFQIRTLQEQLENGPNAQLARLQQENSILRDALNQATSQVESSKLAPCQTLWHLPKGLEWKGSLGPQPPARLPWAAPSPCGPGLAVQVFACPSGALS